MTEVENRDNSRANALVWGISIVLFLYQANNYEHYITVGTKLLTTPFSEWFFWDIFNLLHLFWLPVALYIFIVKVKIGWQLLIGFLYTYIISTIIQYLFYNIPSGDMDLRTIMNYIVSLTLYAVIIGLLHLNVVRSAYNITSKNIRVTFSLASIYMLLYYFYWYYINYCQGFFTSLFRFLTRPLGL